MNFHPQPSKCQAMWHADKWDGCRVWSIHRHHFCKMPPSHVGPHICVCFNTSRHECGCNNWQKADE